MGGETSRPVASVQKAGASVRVAHLEKRFGSVVAVRDVSFDIGEGEFVTLLGPSGSGKTTTLMMIAGFEIPTAGEIYIAGQPMATHPPNRRNIGMVFQSYALFPHMTVFDNIAFPLRMRKWTDHEIRRAVTSALEIVNLVGYERRYPRQLSGGQQQRVAFARAIVFNPPVLLMDEPLGALDKQLRSRLQLEIKRIQQELGITVIYVTHDQEEALVMSDRIIVMDHGSIQQSGTPSELYNQPASIFVAGFLGESNFLAGHVQAVTADCVDFALATRTIRAASSGAVQPGDPAVLVVRPEKVWLTDGQSGDGDEANSVPAVVREVVFAGDHRRVVAAVDGVQEMVIKQPERHAISHFAVGDDVIVQWHPRDCRVLPSQ